MPSRSGLIFAGGRATRLNGVNKALLDVGGSSIVSRILLALKPLVDEQVLLANDTSLEQMEGVKVVYDPRPHAGVLPALAAGLEAATGEVIITCTLTHRVGVYYLGRGSYWVTDFVDDLQAGKFGKPARAPDT